MSENAVLAADLSKQKTNLSPSAPTAERGKSKLLRALKYLVLTAAILTPTALCVWEGLELRDSRREIDSLHTELLWQEEQYQQLAAGAVPENTSPPPPAELPAWQALYPDLYAQSTALGTVDQEKTVYLTFDDGPSARTPEILSILETYGVKATFFVTGKESEQGQQWMRDIVSSGHAIGVHSYTHDYQTIYSSVEAFLEDFDRLYRQITQVTGTAPQIFRFPGGSINGYNGATYQDIVAEMVRRGFVYFDWNVAVGDAVKRPPAASVLARNALSKVDSLRRAVILMHDSTGMVSTVEALPKIIEGYQNAGFTFDVLTPQVKPVIYAYPSA